MQIHKRERIVSQANIEVSEILHVRGEDGSLGQYGDSLAPITLLLLSIVDVEVDVVLTDRQLETRDGIAAVFERHKLTAGERVRILASELGSEGKWWIRSERHPDNPDHPGGLA